MALIECCTHGGNHGRDALLVCHQNIGVAFHDGEEAAFFAILAGEVEAEELFTFGEQCRVDGVVIFGGALGGRCAWENPATKTDSLAAGIADGEHHALAEAVEKAIIVSAQNAENLEDIQVEAIALCFAKNPIPAGR